MNQRIKGSFVILLLLASVQLVAQKKNYDLKALLESGKLRIQNRNAISSTNPKGVKLDEHAGQGFAWLTGETFSSGTIEIDLKGRDVLQRSFVGIAFHVANDSTFDAIYFRPFNFHAKDPLRKIHAVQYICHPVYGWEKLREERNGVFEKGLVNPPDANAWFHARIEVYGGVVKVYVNDDKIPSLTVNKLNDRTNGNVGLWVGESADGDFANLTVTQK